MEFLDQPAILIHHQILDTLPLQLSGQGTPDPAIAAEHDMVVYPVAVPG